MVYTEYIKYVLERMKKVKRTEAFYIFSLPPPSDLHSFPPREINKLETPEDESEIRSVIMANMQPLNINSQ